MGLLNNGDPGRKSSLGKFKQKYFSFTTLTHRVKLELPLLLKLRVSFTGNLLSMYLT